MTVEEAATTGVEARERVAGLDTTDSRIADGVRSPRWKSVGIGGASDEASWRELRRRNQSMTAFAFPDGVGLGVGCCSCCQLASRSVLKRLSTGGAEDGGSVGGGISAWDALFERSREATIAASTLTRACFGTLDLTLLRKGCRLRAFCLRLDLRRFETSSRAPSVLGEVGEATAPVASTRVAARDALSLGPAWLLRSERMENRSEDMVGLWRLAVDEPSEVACEACVAVLVFGL